MIPTCKKAVFGNGYRSALTDKCVTLNSHDPFCEDCSVMAKNDEVIEFRHGAADAHGTSMTTEVPDTIEPYLQEHDVMRPSTASSPTIDCRCLAKYILKQKLGVFP